MTYGYVRVSTDRQTVENQRFEIARFAARGGVAIDGWIEETASGTTCWSKRGLGRLLERVREGDLIVCAELSRLGRSLFMIMEILNFCMNRGCRVWSVKDGYRLGDDIQSKVLAFAFGLSAEIERDRSLDRHAAMFRIDDEVGEVPPLNGRVERTDRRRADLCADDKQIDRLARDGGGLAGRKGPDHRYVTRIIEFRE